MKRPVSSGEPIGERATSVHRGPYARTFDRRRRDILATAWDMIAESGHDHFSLAELGKRSGVALRTIYNAFVDKEGVIAQAVATHHDALFEAISVGFDESHTLDEAMAMCELVAVETLKVRGFSVAAAHMYFSPRTPSKIVDSFRQMPIFILKSWLRSKEVDRALVGKVGLDSLERNFANVQWSAVSEWAAGRLEDKLLAIEMKRNILFIGLACGNREGRSKAKGLLRENGLPELAGAAQGRGRAPFSTG